jgi:hypothetical protein
MVEAGNGGGGEHDSHQDQPLAGLGEIALFDALLDEPQRGCVLDQGPDLCTIQT